MKPSLKKEHICLILQNIRKKNRTKPTTLKQQLGLFLCVLSYKVWWLFRYWYCLHNDFPHQTQQNVATSIDSNCKVRIKAVKLLYLGAKREANFGPLVKDKWNICQFKLVLFLGSQFQGGKKRETNTKHHCSYRAVNAIPHSFVQNQMGRARWEGSHPNLPLASKHTQVDAQEKL